MSKIVMEHVTKKIGESCVLSDISLEMTPGTIYGLRGKNGCGKTMLMRAICGLILPSSGRILIDGKELHKDIRIPPSIGALIENPSFLPGYTGYQNLKMLASLSEGISDEDVVKAIERTGMDAEDSRTYRKYSLGMRQKLGIANAWMGEPDIIILDEPINALDEESVEIVKRELLAIARKGKIIVVACHDREELEYLCDVVYEMKEGKIVGGRETGR